MVIDSKALLSCFNETRATALDASTYNFEKACETISQVYSDWEFDVPKRFIEYETTMDAVKDYANWKDEVKSIPTHWLYKFPFTLPSGIWTYIYSDRKNYHLGYRRTKASVTKEINISGGSQAVTREFIRDIYRLLYKEISKTEIEELGKKVDEIMEVEDVMDDLEYTLLDRDEIGMVSSNEMFILGNIDVMIFEVAVCNYLIKSHDIMYYEPYIKYINDMIKYCGIYFAFNDICIVCRK